MPGVIRPYTLVDVLSTIYDQATAGSQGLNGQAIVVVGIVAEVDETVTVVDSAITDSATNATWDNGVWNGFAWS
jgi:hypothetical protein